MKEAESILRQWRELERQLETADENSRGDLHARIRELRDRYQRLVDDVEGHAMPPAASAAPVEDV